MDLGVVVGGGIAVGVTDRADASVDLLYTPGVIPVGGADSYWSGPRQRLSSARSGSLSPLRTLDRDGGRIDRLAGRKGLCLSVVATVLPNVLNGYTSIEARTTSTGEGKRRWVTTWVSTPCPCTGSCGH